MKTMVCTGECTEEQLQSGCSHQGLHEKTRYCT
ncbi:hypothetical protein LCGC14_2001010, partial [marine sediment metagenome]